MTDSLFIARTTPSLRQQVVDRLREAILSGQLEAGRKLVERELCESLGVSRTSLREALQHLQAEGLIVNIPHKGPMVASIGPDEARDIYAVREVLEAQAGAGFAVHATQEQIEQLRAALKRLQSRQVRASAGGLIEAKNAFYDILLEGCGNRVIGQVLTQLNNRVTFLRRLTLSESHRLEASLKELAEIVDAIESRDAKRASKLCAVHVQRAAESAMRQMVNRTNPANDEGHGRAVS